MNPASVVDLCACVCAVHNWTGALRTLTLTNARIFVFVFDVVSYTRESVEYVYASSIWLFTMTFLFFGLALFHSLIAAHTHTPLTLACRSRHIYQHHGVTMKKRDCVLCVEYTTNTMNRKQIGRILLYRARSRAHQQPRRINRIQCGASTHGVSDTDSDGWEINANTPNRSAFFYFSYT